MTMTGRRSAIDPFEILWLAGDAWARLDRLTLPYMTAGATTHWYAQNGQRDDKLVIDEHIAITTYHRCRNQPATALVSRHAWTATSCGWSGTTTNGPTSPTVLVALHDHSFASARADAIAEASVLANAAILKLGPRRAAAAMLHPDSRCDANWCQWNARQLLVAPGRFEASNRHG